MRVAAGQRALFDYAARACGQTQRRAGRAVDALAMAGWRMELRPQAVRAYLIVQRIFAADARARGACGTRERRCGACGGGEGLGDFSMPSAVQKPHRREADFSALDAAEVSAVLALRHARRTRGDGGNGADQGSTLRRRARSARAKGTVARRLGRARALLQGVAESGYEREVRIDIYGG